MFVPLNRRKIDILRHEAGHMVVAKTDSRRSSARRRVQERSGLRKGEDEAVIRSRTSGSSRHPICTSFSVAGRLANSPRKPVATY